MKEFLRECEGRFVKEILFFNQNFFVGLASISYRLFAFYLFYVRQMKGCQDLVDFMILMIDGKVLIRN